MLDVHTLNAQDLRGLAPEALVRAAEQGPSGSGGSGRLLAEVSCVAPPPAFVPVQLPCAQPTPDIRIELRRGATAISVTWPSAEATQCAAWMRELLR